MITKTFGIFSFGSLKNCELVYPKDQIVCEKWCALLEGKLSIKP